ncbi:MAG: DUF3592 domain-containing protein [Lachnospiraceae bacterium]|nr:DUF3592 domain-containing protein [Lachnospiraceae bacterium]
MAKTSKKKRDFSLVIFFVIFGLVGIVLLIGGFVYLSSSLRFRSIAVEITGTIADIQASRNSDGDVTHTTYVNYSYGGQNFEHVHLGYYSSSMYVGKEIPLLVDPGQPGHVKSTAGDNVLFVILLGMGLVFTLVGVIPTTHMLVGSAKGKKLMQSGKRLQAVVENIDFNYSVTYNGRHPYVIFCTYQDPYRDVTYRFKKNVMRNPGYAPGDSIDVYVDPDDYSKYVVDADTPANPKVIDYT